MSTDKNEFTEAEKAAIAAVSPDQIDTGKVSLGETWVWILAVLTILASAVVIYSYGVLPARYGVTLNWPLVISLAVTCLYALLFAGLYSSVKSNGRKLDALLLQKQ